MEQLQTVLLSITSEEYIALQNVEAVVVIEFESEERGVWGELVAFGPFDDMKQIVETPALVIVPTGLTLHGQRAVRTSEILGPQDENTTKGANNEKNMDAYWVGVPCRETH